MYRILCGSGNATDVQVEIKEIRSRFEHASQLINDFNAVHGYHALQFFGFFAIFYIYVLHSIIEMVTTGFHEIGMILFATCKMSQTVLISTMIIWGCDQISNQLKRILQSCYKCLLELPVAQTSKEMALEKELKALIEIMATNSSRLSAADFFDINCMIVARMISTVAINLIVVLQFSRNSLDQ
ncbi:PREDICTED: gustatory and odorant receptor 24-like [Nicrophorus vespilloides]|uniref:Gustatory and odorant receptor 24-like n=1 Tax=Nicrophorus vespilloides TaxID=110193 RepID=A0ABM1NA69_NICVS|nr:PREDICTED: gustatory and odorant receptor 24-like [Nicrophorus vespilloides]